MRTQEIPAEKAFKANEAMKLRLVGRPQNQSRVQNWMVILDWTMRREKAGNSRWLAISLNVHAKSDCLDGAE